jgi:hypothetical protein
MIYEKLGRPDSKIEKECVSCSKKSNKLENENGIRNGNEFQWDNPIDPFKYED